MKDELGRKINYLRVSVTDRCNLRCRYCMPEEGIAKKEHNEILQLEEIFEVIKACAALGVDKVRITGGEPLVRGGITDLIKSVAQIGTIKDIALTTNGMRLPALAHDLKQAGLNRINVSLDTLDKDKYKEITRGGNLQNVLDGIKIAQEVGLTPIKINTVLMGGFNDDEIEAFVLMTKEAPIDVRFIELMPIGQAADWAKEYFVPNTLVLDKFKDLQKVESEDKSSPAAYYKLPDAKGKVGLINPISHQFCSACNRLRLTADGKLKPCLHSDYEMDVRAILRNAPGNKEEKLKTAIKEAVCQKPKAHTLNNEDNRPIKRDMYRIGG